LVVYFEYVNTELPYLPIGPAEGCCAAVPLDADQLTEILSSDPRSRVAIRIRDFSITFTMNTQIVPTDLDSAPLISSS